MVLIRSLCGTENLVLGLLLSMMHHIWERGDTLCQEGPDYVPAGALEGYDKAVRSLNFALTV